MKQCGVRNVEEEGEKITQQKDAKKRHSTKSKALVGYTSYIWSSEDTLTKAIINLNLIVNTTNTHIHTRALMTA